MRKLTKSFLSLLLIAAMLASFVVLPAAAEEPAAVQEPAAETQAETTANDSFMKIFHLDCGRKYFTKDWIIALINEISAAGYTHLQLAVGNDGMRFLLDDMSLTVGEKTYSSEDVAAAIHAGNKAYDARQKSYSYSPETDELTQSEMDAILSHAAKMGIEIIPLINNPGHMDAILSAATSLTGVTCSYNSSDTTIDLTKSQAVEFTQAFLQKYINYFAEKGCEYFNIGADEYANDKYSTGSMGFGQLVSDGNYGKFISYVNSVAALVKAAKMKPVAFNDGFYFNNNTYSGTFDTDIVISYWSSGWTGYTSKKPAELATLGHKLINTNGSYYYVLGKNDAFTPGETTTHDPSLYTAVDFTKTVFEGSNVTYSDPLGATFCVWCDNPGAETEQEIAKNVRLVLRAMAQRMGDQEVSVEENVLVSGGFKADGSINVATVSDEATGVSVSAPNLTSVTVKELGESEMPELPEGASAMLAWDIKPYVGDEIYSKEATVTLKIPSDWIGANVYGAVVNDDGTLTTIKDDAVALDEVNSTITFTVPHFSTVLAVKENKSNTIDVTVGETTTVELQGDRIHDGDNHTLLDNEIASVWGKREIAIRGTTTRTLGKKVTDSATGIAAGRYIISDGNGNYLISDNASVSKTEDIANATEWIVAKSGTAITLFDNYYYLRNRSGNSKYSLNLNESANYSGWSNDTNGLYYGDYRLYYSNYSNKWILTNYYYSDYYNYGYLYTYTETTSEDTYKTTLTIKGNKVGTTTLTLGNETYTINVNYKQQQVNAVVGETMTVDVSGTPDTTGLDITIAEVTIAGNKMTVKGLKEGNTSIRVGDTVYNISVSNDNLDTAAPLTIEYWITNKRVSEKASDTDTTYDATKNSKSLEAKDAHVEAGIELKTIVPETGNIKSSTATAVYWKGRRLPSSDKQTEDKGVDKTVTATGTDVTCVRYWGGAWQYSGDGKTWTSFATSDQFIAYYLQKTSVTDEIQTEVVDWGVVPYSDFTYDNGNFVLVDYAVKYQSGELTPSTFPQSKKTQAFHCNYTSSEDLNNTVFKHSGTTGNTATDYYRKIGMVRASNTADYEVYMITLTPSSDLRTTQVADAIANVGSYQYKGTEKVVWVDDEANLGEFEDASLHADGYHVGGEATVPGLEITNRHAMLVTYYIRAVETEDSLLVRYVNKRTKEEFYSYPITVNAGTTFDPSIDLPETKIDGITCLTKGKVINKLDKPQYVSSDLSTMPEIGATYRFSTYECVEVKRSDDGKTVTLYYTFDNTHTFVVDFGVPLKITPSDIGVNVTDGSNYWTDAKCIGAKYGETNIAPGQGLTYTATKPMQSFETLLVTLATGTGENDKTTHTIFLVPATTVYYEPNVAEYTGTWSGDASFNDYQETQKARDTENTYFNFGYDKYYDEAKSAVMSTITPGAAATLTFTGTGLEVYLRTQNTNDTTDPTDPRAQDSTGHSYMLVQVYAGSSTDSTNLKRMSFVDVNNLFVTKGTANGYNTPCWTVDGLTHGQYTVVVRFVRGTKLELNGFRVTNTLGNTTSDIYSTVGEANMQTAEIRNMVLAEADVPALADNWYKVGNDVIDAVFDKDDVITGDKDNVITGAMIISKKDDGAETTVTVDKELVNIGPKNEIYLKPNQAVVMELTESYASVQVGMRSLTGEAVKYKINSGEEQTMNSTVDMYYPISLNNGKGKIVIQNISGGILALTKLKVTTAAATDGGTTGGDSGVEPFTTPEAIRYAMALMRGIDVPEFTDVPEDAWYHDYVYDLVYRGVVNGMTATTYEPDGTLTRAQFVKLLACSLEDADTLKTYEGQHPFRDSEGHWAETYIAWARDKGIVEGVSATEFDPEAPITREQMATIFGRYALKQGIELPKDAAAAQSFPDADKISGYAKEFVELMRLAGILNGYEDGTFRPQNTATRAEAAKLFSVFLSITDKL